MTVYRDEAHFPVTFFEAAALLYSVRVTCSRCRNAAVFEPGGVWWHFHKRGWNDHFDLAGKRFSCGQCALGGLPRVRPRSFEAVREKPGRTLPPPDEREWKRAIRRFRT